MGGRHPTLDAETAAEVSAAGAVRQRVSGTVESIRYRGSPVRYFVALGVELVVEQTVGTEAMSLDQDLIIATDPAGNTVWR